MTGAEALRQDKRRHLLVIIFAERLLIDGKRICSKMFQPFASAEIFA